MKLKDLDKSNALELIKNAPARSFIREVVSYPYGIKFQDALQANLDLAGEVFREDEEFWGRLLSLFKRRDSALSAVSELWLAAHFIRIGWQVRRNKPSINNPISDFVVHAVTLSGVLDLQLEVKRLFASPRGTAPIQLSKWDYPHDIPGVPSTLAESDFNAIVQRRFQNARAQLRSSSMFNTAIQVIAVDVSESRTFQRLIAFDPTTPSSFQTLLGIRTTEAFFAFAVGLDKPELWFGRWLVPVEA